MLNVGQKTMMNIESLVQSIMFFEPYFLGSTILARCALDCSVLIYVYSRGGPKVYGMKGF